MALDLFLFSSAVLVIGLAAFHSVLGERYIVRRLLRREDLPRLFGDDTFTRLTIRYAWHLLSIVCVGLATILMWMSTDAARVVDPVVWLIAATLALCGAWGLVATRGRHLSWAVLLVAAGLALWPVI